MIASRWHIVRWFFYAVALAAFAYGTYKLHVVPDRATRLDFWLVMGSIVIAGIFTLMEHLRVRRQRRKHGYQFPAP